MHTTQERTPKLSKVFDPSSLSMALQFIAMRMEAGGMSQFDFRHVEFEVPSKRDETGVEQ